MKAARKHTEITFRARRADVTFEERLRQRLGALLHERETLDEEVKQLRAAVQIYAEVVRRLQVTVPQRAAYPGLGADIPY